ncbi:MAG: hypothetical protein ACOH13_09230 [Flavobacteriales bacterium]
MIGSFAINTFAQTTGKLRMLVDPGDSYEFVVDHQFRMQEREVELTTGPHHFSFWAPERVVVDTTLTVVEGRTTSIVMHLPYARSYLIYQRDLQSYERSMKLYRLLPVAVTGGALLYTVLSYSKMKKAHDQLDEDQKTYDDARSPFRISVLKSQTIPAHKDDFKKAQMRYGISTGVTLLCAGATVYLFHRSGQVTRPTYDDQEKIRFDGLSWMPGPDGGTWTGGLTWNLTR